MTTVAFAILAGSVDDFWVTSQLAQNWKIGLYRRAVLLLRQILGTAPDPELLHVIHTLENRAQELLVRDRKNMTAKNSVAEGAELAMIIETLCQERPTMTEYVERLEARGVVVKAFMNEEHIVRGLRYEYQGQAYSSKQLGGSSRGAGSRAWE
jgi:hypothetical protein